MPCIVTLCLGYSQDNILAVPLNDHHRNVEIIDQEDLDAGRGRIRHRSESTAGPLAG